MIIISKKNYQLPLPEKITVIGSRVTTSAQPQFRFENNQLILNDNWVIQLVHTTHPRSKEPQLLEFPIVWEEAWPWDQELPASATLTYKSKPRILLINSLAPKHSSPVLNLTLETPLAIELNEQGAKPILINPIPAPVENKVPIQPPVQPEYANLQQTQQLLEEKHLEMSQTIAELVQRLSRLEEQQAEQQQQMAKLSGYVVDSFRLAPVTKAILEVYQNGNEEPVSKLATNNQGYFAIDNLLSGTYEIKVKHPRYLPFIMKNYVIANGENKSQDFILKRI